jgi:hypothetical protein
LRKKLCSGCFAGFFSSCTASTPGGGWAICWGPGCCAPPTCLILISLVSEGRTAVALEMRSTSLGTCGGVNVSAWDDSTHARWLRICRLMKTQKFNATRTSAVPIQDWWPCDAWKSRPTITPFLSRCKVNTSSKFETRSWH